MNIYRQLGARLTTLGGDSTPPCVYGDGSTCEETKKWAMNLLGFNDPRIQYHSWVECEDYSNVVPSRAEISGVHCRLHPRSKPGTFDLDWADVANHPLSICNLEPNDLYDALLQAKEKAEELLERMSEQYIWTKNSHYDERFFWDKDEHEWYYVGRKVYIVNFWICIPFEGQYWRHES